MKHGYGEKEIWNRRNLVSAFPVGNCYAFVDQTALNERFLLFFYHGLLKLGKAWLRQISHHRTTLSKPRPKKYWQAIFEN